jgi:hypothetical protein
VKKMELVLVKGRVERNFITLLPMVAIERYEMWKGKLYIIQIGFLMLNLELRFVKGGGKWQEK